MCNRGFAVEKLRALTSLRDATKARKSSSSWSESATGSTRTRVPSIFSTQTLSAPVMMMFSTVSSSTRGCSRPSPKRALNTASAITSCSSTVHAVSPSWSRSATVACSSSWMIARPISFSVSGSVPRPLLVRAAVNWSEAWERSIATCCQSMPWGGAGARGAGGATGVSTGTSRGRSSAGWDPIGPARAWAAGRRIWVIGFRVGPSGSTPWGGPPKMGSSVGSLGRPVIAGSSPPTPGRGRRGMKRHEVPGLRRARTC